MFFHKKNHLCWFDDFSGSLDLWSKIPRYLVFFLFEGKLNIFCWKKTFLKFFRYFAYKRSFSTFIHLKKTFKTAFRMDQRPYRLVKRYICDRCQFSWKKEIQDEYFGRDTCQRCSEPTNAICVSHSNVELKFRYKNLCLFKSGQKNLHWIEETTEELSWMDQIPVKMFINQNWQKIRSFNFKSLRSWNQQILVSIQDFCKKIVRKKKRLKCEWIESSNDSHLELNICINNRN